MDRDSLRGPDRGMTGRRHTVRQRVAAEVRRFAVMFLYLWILFGLFVLNERIILRQEGVGFASQGFAVFNALVLAKVMLVAETLNLGDRFRRGPLVYTILCQSFLFSILFISFHIVEKVVLGLVKGESLAASVPGIGGGGLAGVVCVGVILFVALTPFFAFRELSRVLGPGRLNAMLFRQIRHAAESDIA